MSTELALRGLGEVRARIEKGWCQGEWALDAHGATTYEGSQRAASWCLSGACANVACEQGVRRILSRVVWPESGTTSLVHFNDHVATCKEDVLAVIDKAIARARLSLDALMPPPAEPTPSVFVRIVLEARRLFHA